MRKIIISVPDKCDINCPCTSTSKGGEYFCKLTLTWVDKNNPACNILEIKGENNGKQK